MDRSEHWNRIYKKKQPSEVSWYCPHLERSLELFASAAKGRDARIIELGGGESTLVDDLLDLGYRNITVLDISAVALEFTRKRLAARAGSVTWLAGDVTTVEFPEKQYDIWHDRAVFHFLTQRADRQAYLRQLDKALKPGGHLIISTFGLQGPRRCSGLDVVRYGAESLRFELGDRFRLLQQFSCEHQTPSGATQQFLYCHFTTSDSD